MSRRDPLESRAASNCLPMSRDPLKSRAASNCLPMSREPSKRFPVSTLKVSKRGVWWLSLEGALKSVSLFLEASKCVWWLSLVEASKRVSLFLEEVSKCTPVFLVGMAVWCGSIFMILEPVWCGNFLAGPPACSLFLLELAPCSKFRLELSTSWEFLLELSWTLNFTPFSKFRLELSPCSKFLVESRRRSHFFSKLLCSESLFSSAIFSFCLPGERSILIPLCSNASAEYHVDQILSVSNLFYFDTIMFIPVSQILRYSILFVLLLCNTC